MPTGGFSLASKHHLFGANKGCVKCACSLVALVRGHDRSPSIRLFAATKNLPDLLAEAYLVKRFQQQIDAWIKAAMVDYGIAGIAGRKQHFQVRKASAEFICKRAPIDSAR